MPIYLQEKLGVAPVSLPGGLEPSGLRARIDATPQVYLDDATGRHPAVAPPLRAVSARRVWFCNRPAATALGTRARPRALPIARGLGARGLCARGTSARGICAVYLCVVRVGGMCP